MYPLVRSTMPLDSGSLGGVCTILQPNAPANAITGSHSLALPMPDSRSHTSRVGTAVKVCSRRSHIPAKRSSVVRDGKIRAPAKREWEATI
ncbi:hypothetical protein M5J20_08930, partial [Corynebacterium sp. TA-R-1]